MAINWEADSLPVCEDSILKEKQVFSELSISSFKVFLFPEFHPSKMIYDSIIWLLLHQKWPKMNTWESAVAPPNLGKRCLGMQNNICGLSLWQSVYIWQGRRRKVLDKAQLALRKSRGEMVFFSQIKRIPSRSLQFTLVWLPIWKGSMINSRRSACVYCSITRQGGNWEGSGDS